jgi:uncharacterized membrane protein YgdD (TMEM256/DUF423 family)
MNKILWLRLVGISGAVCVILGAFAAHGLEGRLSERYMDVFQTAVLYQFLHTLALIGIFWFIVSVGCYPHWGSWNDHSHRW